MISMLDLAWLSFFLDFCLDKGSHRHSFLGIIITIPSSNRNGASKFNFARSRLKIGKNLVVKQNHGDIQSGQTFKLCPRNIFLLFLAATKQLYKWYFPFVRLSVCPSVRPSVRMSVCLSVTPFWLCSHHRIIMKFSGVITNDQSKVHAKGQGQRSNVKVT